MRMAPLVVADRIPPEYGAQSGTKFGFLILICMAHAALFVAYRPMAGSIYSRHGSQPVPSVTASILVSSIMRGRSLEEKEPSASNHHAGQSRIGKSNPRSSNAVNLSSRPDTEQAPIAEDKIQSSEAASSAPVLDVDRLVKDAVKSADLFKEPKRGVLTTEPDSLQRRLEKAISGAGKRQLTFETIDLGGTKIDKIGNTCYTADLPYKAGEFGGAPRVKEIPCPADRSASKTAK